MVGIRGILFTPTIPTAQSTANTRITAELMTFTGTPTAAPQAVASHDSRQVLNPNIVVVTASTGIVPTAGAPLAAGIAGWQIPVTAAGQGAQVPYDLLKYAMGEGPILREGEGLVIRQADVADANKHFMVDLDFTVFTQPF
jgi:hypothetical protein